MMTTKIQARPFQDYTNHVICTFTSLVWLCDKESLEMPVAQV